LENVVKKRTEIIYLHIDTDDHENLKLVMNKDPILKTTMRLSNVLNSIIEHQLKLAATSSSSGISIGSTHSRKNKKNRSKVSKVKRNSRQKRFMMLKGCMKYYNKHIKLLNI
jgi:hypothetical protein